MDRYQIAIQANPKHYHKLPAAYDVSKAYNDLICWIHSRIVLDASALTSAVIECAIVKVAIKFSCPVFVDSKTKTRLMPILYGYSQVYSSGTYPSAVVYLTRNDSKVPAGIDPLLIVWKEEICSTPKS